MLYNERHGKLLRTSVVSSVARFAHPSGVK